MQRNLFFLFVGGLIWATTLTSVYAQPKRLFPQVHIDSSNPFVIYKKLVHLLKRCKKAELSEKNPSYCAHVDILVRGDAYKLFVKEGIQHYSKGFLQHRRKLHDLFRTGFAHRDGIPFILYFGKDDLRQRKLQTKELDLGGLRTRWVTSGEAKLTAWRGCKHCQFTDFSDGPANLKGKKKETKVQLNRFLSGKPVKAQILRRILSNDLTTRRFRTLKQNEIRRLRYTVYALQGARFQSKQIRRFFQKQQWYRAKRNFNKVRLNSKAKKSVKLLQNLEKKSQTKTKRSSPKARKSKRKKRRKRRKRRRRRRRR